MSTKLNSIEEAIEDIRNGKIIIVVDDEDRENEGDFLTAARNATPEVINFMATHGKGLICAPLTENRCQELDLGLMTGANTASHETNFTISVDLLGHGCTTGISASDRSKTTLSLIEKDTKPTDLGRPGHIFPLMAKKGGVLRRAGHTEAAVDLSRLAGFEPAGVIVEIMNEDGSMARLDDLLKIAEKFDLKIISIEDLIEFRLKKESLIHQEVAVDMPTKWGDFTLTAYTQINNNQVHLAITMGKWEKDEPILVRVHSSSMSADIFGSFQSDNQSSIHASMELIAEEGKGAIVYINQIGRGAGLVKWLNAYKDSGEEDAMNSAPNPDDRDYGIGAQILRSLNISKMRLITNHPVKRVGIDSFGLEIVENVPLAAETPA
ncbi:MAG: 3,4-dihydroxy 2-butanone 4-phosphate synthase/GTP cyclohydrolase II [Sphingobacteriales bacterium]|jgi:3,4-dihydroxy 2-butanone 4-phosphate synthase/GTP cyclohydrolase II